MSLDAHFYVLREVDLLIKIRYTDLPAGLHARAEAQGRSTIVYLLPGLTPLERRAALGRVRRNAGLGHGPKLPAAGIVVAVMADQVQATLRNGAAAFRARPLLLLPPLIIAVTTTFAYTMLVAVTIPGRPPQASGPGGAIGGNHHRPRPGQSAAPGRIGNRAGPAPSGRPGSGGSSRSPRPARSPGSSPSPSPSPAPTVSASASPSSAPSSQPSGSPGPTSPPSTPPSTPTPSPLPSLSPSASERA
jgi:hypothetical protein